MSFIQMWDENGEDIILSEYGLTGLKLIIPSPSYEPTREAVLGRAGAITLGRDLYPRQLTAEFKMTADNYENSLSVRDKVFSLFGKGKKFYIGETKQPNKRWHVECVEAWNPQRINHNNFTIAVPLLVESGYAESVKNTLDRTLFPAQISSAKQIKYIHATTTFEIFNDGIKIDPRYMPFIVKYKGASTNLKITNLTTGDEWSYTGTSNSGDSIMLDGIKSTKNGLSIFRSTNKKLITLAPGWNEFKLSGTSGSFEISFDFRFYTL
jgi:hypothetical protein